MHPRTAAPCLVIFAVAGCDGAEPEPFSLTFAATADGADVDCSTGVTGVGPGGTHELGLSDLRFYVSNLVLRDADGEEVEVRLDEDEFQYRGDSGWVGLVDLTGDTDGSCAADAISFSEGTARVHPAITGRTVVADVASVSFDVGVPQALMAEVIAEHSVEAAPSPLDEMYWSWSSGYRHFVFNATVSDGVDEGEGYLHLGSGDCASDGYLALEDREACTFVNTPTVEIDGFDLAADAVAVDLAAAIRGLDLLAPIYDPETFEVIGEEPGISCHSSPMQDDCPPIFENFGMAIDTGAAQAGSNAVFGKR